MKVYNKNGDVIEIQDVNDTGWEILLADESLKGRILNGYATLVFEGPLLEGNDGQKNTSIKLPDKYMPSIFPLDFSLHTNEVKPKSVFAGINRLDGLYFYMIGTNMNPVGTVTYPL